MRTNTTARAQAEREYKSALAALDRPAGRPAVDPYGRTLALARGDLILTRDADGLRDLATVVGPAELVQAIEVLVGTAQGSDVFNRLFGFDVLQALAQPVGAREQRELVRLSVVKALAQEPRVRQIQAVAFVDEKAFLRIRPGLTAEQQRTAAREQSASRRWELGVLLDTRLGEQVTLTLAGGS